MLIVETLTLIIIFTYGVSRPVVSLVHCAVSRLRRAHNLHFLGIIGVEVEQEPVRWDRRLTDWFLWVEGRMGPWGRLLERQEVNGW